MVISDFSYLFTNSILLMQTNMKIVPAFLGHKYRPLKVLDMELLQSVYRKHKRLRVFANKGLQCAYCPKRGMYLIKCVDRGGAVHVDLYTDQFELMTIDHVLPKSKGGTNDLENLVPCCNRCNTKKGNKIL